MIIILISIYSGFVWGNLVDIAIKDIKNEEGNLKQLAMLICFILFPVIAPFAGILYFIEKYHIN